MIPKEMKYNLHYGDVRGDVLSPPNGNAVLELNVCSLIGKPSHEFRLSHVKRHKSYEMETFFYNLSVVINL